MMKLDSIRRKRLRTAIRAHFDVAEFVSSGSEISSMSDERMLEVADLLGFNVGAATNFPHLIDLDSALEKHSMAHPAFTGQIAFDLSVNLLGIVVDRKARLAFSYTPDWRYFDAESARNRLAHEYRAVAIEVLAAPDFDAWVLNEQLEVVKASNEPRWLAIHLGERGVLPNAVWSEVDRLIDEHCRKADEDRRRTAISK